SQTRLAWSPYGSPQADPYTWGTARLPGYTPPTWPPAPPRIPTESTRSTDSPASLAQAHRTGVPIAHP
ncbi:MAG TPA: hypothetical protein VIU15_30400, partial [Streptomyces sp.]